MYHRLLTDMINGSKIDNIRKKKNKKRKKSRHGYTWACYEHSSSGLFCARALAPVSGKHIFAIGAEIRSAFEDNFRYNIHFPNTHVQTVCPLSNCHVFFAGICFEMTRTDTKKRKPKY